MPIWIVVAILAGAAVALFGIVKLIAMLARTARRRRGGTTTTGVVVSVDKRLVHEAPPFYVPTVEIPGPNGPLRFENREAVAGPPAPGEQVPVWFDPADPNARPEVLDGSAVGSVLTYVMVIVVGLALIAFMLWFNTVLGGASR